MQRSQPLSHHHLRLVPFLRSILDSMCQAEKRDYSYHESCGISHIIVLQYFVRMYLLPTGMMWMSVSFKGVDWWRISAHHSPRDPPDLISWCLLIGFLSPFDMHISRNRHKTTPPHHVSASSSYQVHQRLQCNCQLAYSASTSGVGVR